MVIVISYFCRKNIATCFLSTTSKIYDALSDKNDQKGTIWRNHSVHLYYTKLKTSRFTCDDFCCRSWRQQEYKWARAENVLLIEIRNQKLYILINQSFFYANHFIWAQRTEYFIFGHHKGSQIPIVPNIQITLWNPNPRFAPKNAPFAN